MDYTQFSIDELEAKNLQFMQDIDNLRKEQLLCAEALDKKLREQELISKFNGLTTEEIEVLKKLSQSAGTASIQSEENVSVPG